MTTASDEISSAPAPVKANPNTTNAAGEVKAVKPVSKFRIVIGKDGKGYLDTSKNKPMDTPILNLCEGES